VLVGPVGTGKTHVATALGIEAIKRGHLSLLLLDELGFVSLEKAGGELLFDALSARHERAATVITSNLGRGRGRPSRGRGRGSHVASAPSVARRRRAVVGDAAGERLNGRRGAPHAGAGSISLWLPTGTRAVSKRCGAFNLRP
jgi:hypothetical protein